MDDDPGVSDHDGGAVDVDVRLQVGDVTVDERDADLLRAVAREGSLSAAAESLGRSYSRAHGRITALEAAAGPLVARERGGAGGGGSELTDRARDLLARFGRIGATLSDVALADELVVSGTVSEREGDLVTAETALGPLRALAVGDAAAVRVTVRADAVILHDPAAVPAADATSARNRLPGTVEAIERGAATATVRVDVGVETPLAVRVTGESLDRLELAAGSEVVASFKATATYATPRAPE